MFLLNLTLAELLAIFGAVSGLVVALYLLDRSRRRQVVASLRFWAPAERPTAMRSRRRRIQQPLSLLLQILSLALLLLAIGQLRWGARQGAYRDHVLVLDTSAWMAARSGTGTLMDEARALARSWLRSLPASDRVLLIRAGSLATAATGFESNRAAIRQAIDLSYPGATALDINRALDLARRVQDLHAGAPGEIVYAGAGRAGEHEAATAGQALANLRVLPVSAAVENVGLKEIGLRRSAADPGSWEIYVSVRNYGSTARTVPLALQFGGGPAGTRRLTLAPGAIGSATFELRTRAAGWLEARLLAEDSFAGDDQAILELPEQPILRVVVYSDQPSRLRPILAANPNAEAVFRKPAEYAPDRDAGIVVLDRFHPTPLPAADTIWIEPSEGSPVRMLRELPSATLARWRSDHPLAAGLRAKDLRLGPVRIFAPSAGDIAVAEVEEGPVLVARPGTPKMVFLGFDPAQSALRYELATPLMFANILRWISPEIFRRWELNAGSAGTVTVALEPDADLSQVRVLSDDQTPLPYTTQGRTLTFFAGTPSTVRVVTGNRERVYSLTLPEVAAARWEPPQQARRGIPSAPPPPAGSRDLWQLLALLGGVGLLIEWLLFGEPMRRLRAPRAGVFLPSTPRLRTLFSSLLRKAS